MEIQHAVVALPIADIQPHNRVIRRRDRGRIAVGGREPVIAETLKREQGIITPHVFCYVKGEKAGRGITEGGFNKAWRKARVAAGCPGRIPHDFRRTAVRNLVRAGVPERVAMQLTGHKTRAVFERYNIVSAGDLRDAARRLDTFASGAAS